MAGGCAVGQLELSAPVSIHRPSEPFVVGGGNRALQPFALVRRQAWQRRREIQDVLRPRRLRLVPIAELASRDEGGIPFLRADRAKIHATSPGVSVPTRHRA
jgi:hypothetical protein